MTDGFLNEQLKNNEISTEGNFTEVNKNPFLLQKDAQKFLNRYKTRNSLPEPEQGQGKIPFTLPQDVNADILYDTSKQRLEEEFPKKRGSKLYKYEGWTRKKKKKF